MLHIEKLVSSMTEKRMSVSNEGYIEENKWEKAAKECSARRAYALAKKLKMDTKLLFRHPQVMLFMGLFAVRHMLL